MHTCIHTAADGKMVQVARPTCQRACSAGMRGAHAIQWVALFSRAAAAAAVPVRRKPSTATTAATAAVPAVAAALVP